MTMHNFHVPLPDEIYQQLRAETKRLNQPATQLVRQAIETWLRQQRQITLHDEIQRYAQRHGGTDIDLDTDLEIAAQDHLAHLEDDRP